MYIVMTAVLYIISLADLTLNDEESLSDVDLNVEFLHIICLMCRKLILFLHKYLIYWSSLGSDCVEVFLSVS